jgi:hypothetical protein
MVEESGKGKGIRECGWGFVSRSGEGEEIWYMMKECECALGFQNMVSRSGGGGEHE